jgi:hypothetical protein
MKGANHEGIKHTVFHYKFFDFGILCGAAFLVRSQAEVRTGGLPFSMQENMSKRFPILIRPLNWIRIMCKPMCVLADRILTSAHGGKQLAL